MNWIQKLFYKMSGHSDEKKPLDVPTALQAMLEKGISIGKKNAQPMIVEKRVCRRHEMVMLIEVEIGRYICPICEEERHKMNPLQIVHQGLSQGMGPHTAIQRAAGRYQTKKLHPIKS